MSRFDKTTPRRDWTQLGQAKIWVHPDDPSIDLWLRYACGGVNVVLARVDRQRTDLEVHARGTRLEWALCMPCGLRTVLKANLR